MNHMQKNIPLNERFFTKKTKKKESKIGGWNDLARMHKGDTFLGGKKWETAKKNNKTKTSI